MLACMSMMIPTLHEERDRRERERETESEREKRKVKKKKKSRKREFAQPQSAWRGLGVKKQSKSKHWMDMGRA